MNFDKKRHLGIITLVIVLPRYVSLTYYTTPDKAVFTIQMFLGGADCKNTAAVPENIACLNAKSFAKLRANDHHI